jgi:hypothetical protein
MGREEPEAGTTAADEHEAAEEAAATGGEETAAAASAEEATAQLAASAGEHVPDAGAEAASEQSDEDEYELEQVIVVRRPIFIVAAAVVVLAIAALVALNVYQWRKPAPAVATVNGAKISRGDYDKAVARGDGSQVLDQLISQKLVESDASKKHVTATPDEIDAKLKEAKSQFSTDAEYRQALSTNNVTEPQLRESIRLQVLLQKLVYDKVQVSDAEIQQEFDKNKDTQYQGKSLDDVKADIQKTLMDQKQQDALQSYLANLRTSAKIVKHIPGATGSANSD